MPRSHLNMRASVGRPLEQVKALFQFASGHGVRLDSAKSAAQFFVMLLSRGQIGLSPANGVPEVSETSTLPLELSIVMPCLNEAETVSVCVTKALSWLARAGVAGEVIV